MKIELKYIVGYLPYGLRVIDFQMHENGFRQKHSIKQLVLIPSNLEIGLKDIDGINQKPILRPLSDLTKEIEVNGEKFVPTHELYKLIDEFGIGSPTIVISKTFSGISIHWYYGKQQSSTNPVPLSFYEKLYEWHFDLHSLIEKGLAIDKNTLL